MVRALNADLTATMPNPSNFISGQTVSNGLLSPEIRAGGTSSGADAR
jgi:hypothetical protein